MEKIEPQTVSKDFYELYNELDRQEKRKLRKEIVKTCMIEFPTFYSWMRRKKVSQLAMLKIAEIMDTDVFELFPESIETNEFNKN